MIPTFTPETAGGTIYQHVKRLLDKMNNRNIAEAKFWFNEIELTVYQSSHVSDIVEKYLLKQELRRHNLY